MLEQALRMSPRCDRFVVRHYDGFDREWVDVTEPLPAAEAMCVWNEKTSDGTQLSQYDDIDYFAIHPADVVMRESAAGRRIAELLDEA